MSYQNMQKTQTNKEFTPTKSQKSSLPDAFMNPRQCSAAVASPSILCECSIDATAGLVQAISARVAFGCALLAKDANFRIVLCSTWRTLALQ
jgi:hypothetical protein